MSVDGRIILAMKLTKFAASPHVLKQRGKRHSLFQLQTDKRSILPVVHYSSSDL